MTRTLIHNALVLTVDEGMTVHQGAFVLVEDDRIGAIGSGPGMPPADTVVDFGGDILMPGFVNTHCHLPMTVFRGLAEDMPDRLARFVFPIEKRFVTAEMVRIASLHAALELIEGGVTTVADMYYFETEVGRAIAETGMRGIVGQTVMSVPAPDAATADEGFERFEELCDAFAGHPLVTPSLAPHAPYTTGIELLSRVASTWEKTGHPVQIHLSEMTHEMAWVKERHGGTPVQMMAEAGLLQPGLIAAHCLYLTDADIAAMTQARIGVAHCAGSNAKSGRGIARVLAMREAGIPVGIGSDGPMSGNTIDLFAQLPQVAKLQKIAAGTSMVMPARDVVRMATIEGARVLGMDSRIGSIETGKQADLVRIDLSASRLTPMHDAYATLVYAAQAGDVRDVMVAGDWILHDRVPQRLDRGGILAASGELAAAIATEQRRLMAG